MILIEKEEELHPLRQLALQDMSYSRISTYEWCQLKYYYHYIMQYPEEYGSPALLGNIIHKALEVSIVDGEEINKSELLSNYRAAIEDFDPEHTIPSTMIQDGETMLLEYADANPGPQSVYAQELPFSFVVGNARINGFMDHVSVSDTSVNITDYKSGKAKITWAQTPTNMQLGIYSLYLRELFPDKEIHAELYYLRDSNNRYHTYTSEELDQMEDLVAAKTQEILNKETFHPTPNTRNCRWCSYATDGTCAVGASRMSKSW